MTRDTVPRLPPLRLAPPAPGHLAADPGAHWTLVMPADPAVIEAAARAGLEPALDGMAVTVRAPRASLPGFADALAERGAPAGAILRRALYPVISWQLRTIDLPLDRPHIMGILNLTSDSFSGDGVGASVAGALRRAEALREAGAALVDVGAETARADRPVVEAATEAALVAPVVEALVREGHAVTIDSYKPEVARVALAAGAQAVNDISGLTIGTGAAEEAARAGAGYVLNYSYTVPKRRPPAPPVYDDVVTGTIAWIAARLDQLRAAGLDDPSIAVDPGIAFGKSHDEDLQVLRRLSEFSTLGLPLLLAHSRKNFIGSVTGRPPADRDLETHAVTALAFAAGARIFRVHDVEGTRRTLEMARAIVAGRPGDFAPDRESWPWRAGVSATHAATARPAAPPPPGQRW